MSSSVNGAIFSSFPMEKDKNVNGKLEYTFSCTKDEDQHMQCAYLYLKEMEKSARSVSLCCKKKC